MNKYTTQQMKVLRYMEDKDLTIRDATLELNLNGSTFTKIISELIRKGCEIDKWDECYINAEGEHRRYRVYSLRSVS